MPLNSQQLPEVFRPDDARWAMRAAAKGDIRRVVRGLYTTNLDEPVEQLLRRRWFDIAAIYFPECVVVDRSAIDGGPTSDGSLFLDVGPRPVNPRRVELPGLALRPRNGPGRVAGDMEFAGIWMSSQARAVLDNLRASRARRGISRTVGATGVEEWLDRLARLRGEESLNMLRDDARGIAVSIDAEPQFQQLDSLIGALLGTRDAALATPVARARASGAGFDPTRLELFETLRQQLASQQFAERWSHPDPLRQFAFFEAYFSNWIEGTEFEFEEAEAIVFEGKVPAGRPVDAHDIVGTFSAITDPRLGAEAPRSADTLESFLRDAHTMIMGRRPESSPGEFKTVPNRAGETVFVNPDLVRGTLREGGRVLRTLPEGMPRAVFAMFMVTEIHPFTDGNGRVARILMNAELTAAGLCRVAIPKVYRDEYMMALKAISLGGNPVPLVRMVDRAQRWAAMMPWEDRTKLMTQMNETNALVDPADAARNNVHLLDPRSPE